jgi:hypothetical protein
MKLPSNFGPTIRFSLILLLLAGCSSQKVSKLDLLCVGTEGEVFHAQGISAEQAAEIKNDWDFDACNIRVKKQQGSKGLPKQPRKD